MYVCMLCASLIESLSVVHSMAVGPATKFSPELKQGLDVHGLGNLLEWELPSVAAVHVEQQQPSRL